MSSKVDEDVEEPALEPEVDLVEHGVPSRAPFLGVSLLRLLGALAIPLVGFTALWATFDFLRDADANRFLVVAVALVVGVGGVFSLYWGMNRIIDLLPEHYREGVRPYVFVGPALVILSVFLLYPVVNTVLLSFKDSGGRDFVGIDNYDFVFTDDSMVRSIRNTGFWIVLVPLVAVIIGLVFATLADRLTRGEALAKSLIFLPMAISFVGAAVTWRLIYSFRPEGFGTNIGLLNDVRRWMGEEWLFDQARASWIFGGFFALVAALLLARLATRLARGEAAPVSIVLSAVGVVLGVVLAWLLFRWNPTTEPIPWLAQRPWNNGLLMVIMVWMQTGFAMVVLSAAIKSIPDEIIEAARIDGASELQVFRRIIVPSIVPTIVVVATYMVINAMKVFDIVFVMGNAEVNGTEVVAERMIQWFFIRNHDGRGAAIAVVLFVAVVPVMIWNVRQFRKQEAIR